MPGYLTSAWKRAALNGTLVLLSVAALAMISETTRAEQIIRPPEPVVMAMTETEKIVTGVCDFGGYSSATTEETSVVVKDILTTEHVSESYKLPEPVRSPEEEPVLETFSTGEYSGEAMYSPEYFREIGLIDWNGWTWSWYSERVLPGTGLHIPGRHADGGYVRDGDGYICIASDVLDEGAVIDTPFGSPGRVYDCGVGNDYTVDVYVSW